MITLYVVRHGETVDNLEGRIQGHLDSPLTDLGQRQAQAAAERLASEQFAAAYSSDLGRAVATAEIITKPHNLPIQTTPLLREAYLGAVQGLKRAEFEERYPEQYRLWRQDSITNRPPEAERLEDVIEKCRTFIARVIDEREDGDKVLVVVHGGSLRGLICAACRLPVTFYRCIRTANASVSIIDVGDRPALWLLNDTCHLESLKVTEEESDNVFGYRISP
ncbi:histidine phosphatase family protein [bacterium]|nr:histidine phosphatase family protein [bacterium]